jgi:uncharacterized LabA/DUF88 family protein
MAKKNERVIIYIDGFNLYYGLRDNSWRKYYWLNLYKLGESLCSPNQKLQEVKYFTSKISKPRNKRRRQEKYLSALGTLTNLSIHYGRYQSFRQQCSNCGRVYYDTNEKRTDVNIATHMLVDAFQDSFDTAILISADSDLTLPLKEITRLFPNKYVKVAFPPSRSSFDLQNAVATSFHIYESKFRNSLFPNRITLPSGYMINKPRSWS